MTVINTNTAAINAQYNLSKVQSAMDDAMSALSSGKRITSAADDAAGLSIVTRMESQVRGLNQAMRNAADGQSMVDTAEGAMDEMTNMLQRMRELALQAANGSNTDVDRAALNAEVDQLKDEIDRIVGTTTFNGKSLLSGEMSASLQIGVNEGETLSFDIGNMSTAALGSLSGAAPASGVTSAQFNGVEANSTVTQLRFDGTDTYTFKLSVDLGNTTGANNEAGMDTFEITASVAGNDASDVAAAINAAIRDTVLDADGGQEAPANAARFVSVSSVNNVVTIENLYGGDISVSRVGDNHLSEGGGKIEFTSIKADDNVNNPSDNTVLGSNEGRKIAFSNGGGDAGEGVAGTAETQVINVTDNLEQLTGQFSSDSLKLTIGDYELFTDATGVANAAALAAAFNADNVATVAAMTDAGITISSAGDNLTVAWTDVGDQRAVTLSNVTDAVETDPLHANYVEGQDEVSTSANYDRLTYSGLELRADTYKFTYTLDDTSTKTLEVEMTGVPSMSKLANLFNEAAEAEGVPFEFSEEAADILLVKATVPGAAEFDAELGIANPAVADFTLYQGVTNEIATYAAADVDLSAELAYEVAVTGRGSLEITANYSGGDINDLVSALNNSATFQDFELDASTNDAGDLIITSSSGEDETITFSIAGVAVAAVVADSQDGGTDIDVTDALYTLGTVTDEYVEASDAGLTQAANEVQVLELAAVAAEDFAEMTGTAMTLSIGGETLTVNLQSWIDTHNSGQNLADIADLVQAIQDAAGYGAMDWEVSAVGTDELTFTWKDTGPVSGNISIAGLHSTPKATDDADAGGTPGVDAVPGNEDLQGAIMAISPDRADTYAFSLDGTDLQFTYDGTANGLQNFASYIQGKMDLADPNNWAVDAESGSISIAKLDNTSFGISNFSSVGSGRMQAVNWDGQAPADGEYMAILDDTRVDTSATTEGAGFATETKVSMTFDANDIYSFNITDGVATATIKSVGTGTEAGSGDIGDLAVAVETALQRSGLHTAVSVALGAGENELVLTHSLGSQIDITNFKSEKSGIVEVRGVQNTEGYAKFLDDGGSAEDLSRVSEINLGTADGAEAALDIIDRALEDITAQRSELGAVSNRLDHTISNLGNIVVNTEAAQSRIEDADFAAETGNLTKAQILSQAATAMLAQANASKQSVLSLLQG